MHQATHLNWLDTHCHLDAPEFTHDVAEVRQQARQAGVIHCLLPAVEVANFATVRHLAHQFGDSYALGIHPLYTATATLDDLDALDAQLAQSAADPHLVAVGEIGLDGFVPELNMERQIVFFNAQLKLARKYNLPVILHVRHALDLVLKQLRLVAPKTTPSKPPWSGIAHAFNGSLQQAQACLQQGLKLGFGGAITYQRALQLHRLAQQLPLSALVLETDAPDMPPQWLYRTAAQRQAAQPDAKQGRNGPSELPRIAAHIAALRHISHADLAAAMLDNTRAALPKIQQLLH